MRRRIGDEGNSGHGTAQQEGANEAQKQLHRHDERRGDQLM